MKPKRRDTMATFVSHDDQGGKISSHKNRKKWGRTWRTLFAFFLSTSFIWNYFNPYNMSFETRNKSQMEADSLPVLGAGEYRSHQQIFPSLPLRKRQKVHWCNFHNHMGRPKQILIDEYGFNMTVDALQDDDWDIVFGGYPHCGSGPGRRFFDWKMETGLNKHLNQKGWDTLKPHQVWFPCMGCKESYCNKRDLCLITREVFPGSCYKLPEDLEQLKTKMSDSSKLWVLKQDSPTMHAHMGTGVWFITNFTQIPPEESLKDGTYIIQQYVEQHMGDGAYFRRHEIRLYLAITSTAPLRAYVYDEPWVNLANSVYDLTLKNNPSQSKCMLDTHVHIKGCRSEGLTGDEREPTFADFCSNYNLNEEQKERFQKSARDSIAKILNAAHPKIAMHPVNKGIAKSGATCFSFLRVDMAIAANGDASIYEINEFPFSNEKGPQAGRVQTQAYKDLFNMIGLDQPPMPPWERGDYELSHLGGWVSLGTSS